MTAHRLTPREARRIAVRAQLLDASRPTSLLAVVRHLTALQVDQTATVAPSADLVLWSRLGSSYSRAELASALQDGSLIDLQGFLRPGEDIALYRAEMSQWPGGVGAADYRLAQLDWLEANDACRLDILDRLAADGPLRSRDLPDTCSVPWRSSGWNDNRNVRQVLALMSRRGEVAVAGRRGRDRLWDLASRVYPDRPAVPEDEAGAIRDERRLRALGIARRRGPACPVEAIQVGRVGEPAVIEGVKGEWRVDPAQLGRPFSGRAALLSPLDRLVFDRSRMVELFAFDYQLEMYKPADRRRWGYYALPILYGDRLVGKLDATADRAAGVLRVDAVHEDVPFSKPMGAAVNREISDLARWLGLRLMLRR